MVKHQIWTSQWMVTSTTKGATSPMTSTWHAFIIRHNIFIENERRGSYDIDNYEVIVSFVITSTITPETMMSFATISHEAAIHANSTHD